MFSNWPCSQPIYSLNENIKRAAQCRQLEYRKHLNPEKIQKKYEECLMSIPPPIPSNVPKISIGSPVGATFGTIGINHLNPNDISMESYACCLIAFGMAYIIPEKDWNSLIINQILQDGKKLIENSITNDNNSQKQFNEATINKKFVINNNVMEIEIFDPEYTGKVQSTDYTVPTLLTTLKKFFQFSSYGLLWFGNGIYYFIWKKYGMFFIWDSYGRDQETLLKKLGLNAVLVAVRCTENLYYYIVNLGSMNSDEIFSVRKLQMAKIITNCSNLKLDDIKHKNYDKTFEVINDKYAVLKGHTHVGSICFKEFRYKQSLAVAITAILYSKIFPTCCWDKHIIDEIVILGTIFYKVWNNCSHCSDFNISDIPNRIRVGQYMVDITIDVNAEFGEWKCISNYKRSTLTKAIKTSFLKSVNLLLQIENKTYAIWKRNNFYYIFDPYEHQANRGEFERYKSSMLHMCSTVNQCCLILTQLILEIPTVRSYSLHFVRILNIADCRIEGNCKEETISGVSYTTRIQNNEEVKSLNESIEDLTCQKTFECLGDINNKDDNISVADLNSPGMSETQIPKDYFDIQNQIAYDEEIAEAERKLKEDLEQKLNEKKKKELEKSRDKESLSEESMAKIGEFGEILGSEFIEDTGLIEDADQIENGDGIVDNREYEDGDDHKGYSDDVETKDHLVETTNIDAIEGNREKLDSAKEGEDENDSKLELHRTEEYLKNICDEALASKEMFDEKELNELTALTDSDDLDLLDKICKSNDPCTFNKNSCENLKLNMKSELCKEKNFENLKTCDPICQKRKDLHSSVVSQCAKTLAVIGTEKCTSTNLRNLMKTAFKRTDRLLALTVYGNYIIFKHFNEYYIYDGYACDIDRFRYLDLSTDSAGFIRLANLSDVIEFIVDDDTNDYHNRDREQENIKKIIEDICNEYGSE